MHFLIWEIMHVVSCCKGCAQCAVLADPDTQQKGPVLYIEESRMVL